MLVITLVPNERIGADIEVKLLGIIVNYNAPKLADLKVTNSHNSVCEAVAKNTNISPGENILVHILAVARGRVKIGIIADRSIPIERFPKHRCKKDE